jgi:Lrp/AsnC family transcriptional regulator, regulator for asnA, asnC and gidA
MKSENFPSLDQLDIRLIEELEMDVRQNYKDLAVKLEVSIPTITGRVKRLIDGGVISPICWVDSRALGYKYSIIFGICTQPGHEIDVANELATNPHVPAVYLVTGRFSVIAWARFRTGEALSDFLSNDLKHIPTVTSIEKMLMLRELKVSPRLLTDDIGPRTLEYTENSLDDLDLNIIRELQVDARQTTSQLGRKLGVYHSTIFRRMQRLMDENIIRIGASTNPFALGYEGVATVGLKCDPGKAREIAKVVAAYKQVEYVGIYASPYDIVFWVAFRTLNDLEDFTKEELGRILGLKEIDTIVNFKLVKMLFRVPI